MTVDDEVQLMDDNWYPCHLIGNQAALDYDGQRYTVELAEAVTVTDPRKGNKISFPAGRIFRECHADCVRKTKN